MCCIFAVGETCRNTDFSVMRIIIPIDESQFLPVCVYKQLCDTVQCNSEHFLIVQGKKVSQLDRTYSAKFYAC